MMSDDRRSIAQSIILTHTTPKDEKSCSIYSYHDIKHGRDHLVILISTYFRRDTIVTRGDAQSKMNKKVVTKGTFQRQLVDLKKKIKTTIQVYCGLSFRLMKFQFLPIDIIF